MSKAGRTLEESVIAMLEHRRRMLRLKEEREIEESKREEGEEENLTESD